MKSICLAGIVASLISVANTGYAQSIEAHRYMGSQGIEIIQNRDTRIADEKSAAPTPTRIAKAGTGSAIIPASVSRDTKMKVTPKQQGERDQDRLTILKQELLNEAKLYQGKWSALHTPSVKSKLTEGEVQDLKDSVAEHEKNLRALNAEIGRVKVVQ